MKTNLVNRTDRRQDYNNVVARYILENMHDFLGKKILDFGAGKLMIFANKLRNAGLDVDAYDCGDNVTDNHVKETKDYDVIYASNVLNVCESLEDLRKVLSMLNYAVFVCNYPSKPRKAGLKTKDILRELKNNFKTVSRAKCSTPLFICHPRA
jgi:2-polyprenyl-3-methyl-5-hydroxy-6-metoxy-1,4-benzoquinol methylase